MKRIITLLLVLIFTANINSYGQGFGSEITLETVTVTASYNNNDWQTYWAIIMLINQANDYMEENQNTVPDCNNVVGGGASYDYCGNCTGGSTGQSACQPYEMTVDCQGVSGGSAYPSDCGCVGGTTGIAECVKCDNSPFNAASAGVQGGLPPSFEVKLENLRYIWGIFYGYTNPEKIDVTIGACLENGAWHAVLTGVNGGYSKQVELHPGVSEVNSASTTVDNYCKKVDDLVNLGFGDDPKWYVLSAVNAHEDIHVASMQPALTEAMPDIEALIEAFSVANEGQDEATAIAQIMAKNEFKDALKTARNMWFDKLKIKVENDHLPNGAAIKAEKDIVIPIARGICSQAASNGWEICGNCPPETP